MRLTMKRLTTAIIAVFMGGLVAIAPLALGRPAFAECPEGYIPSAILGDNAQYFDAKGNPVSKGTEGATRCIPGNDNGDGVKEILKLVVLIMSVGIGIIGAIGITISGIQYITAGGNEEQTRKAKRRIFEIVIGFFAYVLIYAALTFLIPGFNGF